MRNALIILAIVVVLAAGTPVVIRRVKNPLIGPDHNEDKAGVVRVEPKLILAGVNDDLRKRGLPTITLDELALARALQSEHGGSSLEVRRWVAWAVRNSAGSVGMFVKLTKSRNPETAGYFARQRTDARYAATNAAARLENIELAREVLRAPKSADPTGGATNFFSPKAQDALYKRAQAGDPAVKGRINRDAKAQRAHWIAQGWIPLGAPIGTPAGEVEFFRA